MTSCRAVLALGIALMTAAVGLQPAAVPAAAPPRPHILQKRIPFPDKRKQEMRRYAQRHYGIDDYRLRNPKVIVEHFTATDSFSSAWNTFAQDVPDVELHELPQVCSHFIVDRDGTIYQLVSTTIMCRHTVGLNWTAIGIEHVGTSDAQVMGDARQLRVFPGPHPLAEGQVRDPRAQRDRPRREPLEPVPPRAGGRAPQPDPRRHDPRHDGALPAPAARLISAL